jgi:hypothetical protein
LAPGFALQSGQPLKNENLQNGVTLFQRNRGLAGNSMTSSVRPNPPTKDDVKSKFCLDSDFEVCT